MKSTKICVKIWVQYFEGVARKLIAMILVILASSVNTAAFAAPFFSNQDGSMVWDKDTGLVWMRCRLGQVWSGGVCSGEAKKLSFTEAQSAVTMFNSAGGHLGFTDWKIPTIRQLISIRICETGYSSKISSLSFVDGGAAVYDCINNNIGPGIYPDMFPNTTAYSSWSSDLASNNTNFVWVSFAGGAIANDKRDNKNFVLLTRATRVSGGEATTVFSESLTEKQLIAKGERGIAEKKEQQKREAAELKARQEREVARRKAQQEQEAAERKAQADQELAERKALENRAQALKHLTSLGARSLYLEAGNAQRKGVIIVGSTNFTAQELYILIVEKFPSSEFAIKATDQLNALVRSEKEQRVLREVDQNASSRAQCFSQVNSCVARCKSLGMDYSATQYCVDGCQRNCN